MVVTGYSGVNVGGPTVQYLFIPQIDVARPDLENNTLFPSRPMVLFIVVLSVFIVVQTLVLELPILTQIGIVATQLVVILGGAILYRKKFADPDTKWPSLGSLGMSPVALVVVLAASVSLGFLANAVGALTVHLFPGLVPMAEAYQQEIETLLLPEELGVQILGAIAVVVVAPVAEEFLFRGTILAEQRREQVAFSAILLNGILFSVMHLNPVSFVALAIVGCYFAHITLRSDGLWGAIAGHAVLNLVNGVVLIRVVDDVPGPETVELGEIAMALVILVPVTGFLWWLSVYLIGSPEKREPKEKEPVSEDTTDLSKPLRERPDADQNTSSDAPDAGGSDVDVW